ncbi:biotin--[acetyl-CoA-carboxylase] ligase [Lactobacillus sp. M0398]|uniref:biotin--[acetyl-CoA-carboxylase] ligase n=1 Tax=Lactobacillus TaxID=1578 RepID=UPI0018DC0064|nr:MULTISPECIES: biotin--[acetyl-CoA-carboxylase] ligase [unclassified Lactobacillus]MBI0120622.1 biotin--[acetyl-CoA-carboxylase] ligase [Lactobacillus sp. M0398]MBI0122910.1 biotin--[acetyl-CoA-carboxylase] ligase [Lactobacillus sp. W8174]MBI0134939.1 biotin--[acetyl-CoA-carboxylase] ligase [Lactobacillus sp. W8173]
MNSSKKEAYLKILLNKFQLEINWWRSINSTNLYAKQKLASKGYLGPVLYGSDEQTSGYGKQSRHFISQKGGIYLSLVIKVPQLNWQNQGLLTTGIAWQLHLAINEVFHVETQFKWVNDLLFKGKKIAGILVELPQPQVAVIGIGCNLYQDHLHNELNTAGNLLTKIPSEKHICQFIAQIIKNLLEFIPQFDQSNFLPDYKEKLALMNHDVVLALGKQKIKGKVTDLTQQANLVLETETGLKSFNAGEVTKVRNF